MENQPEWNEQEEEMFKRNFFLILLVLSLPSAGLTGGWNNSLMGCRAIAMGGAFSAVADDPSAIFYNPAGLAFQKKNFNFSIDGFTIWPTHEYVMPTGVRAESKYTVSVPQIFMTYRTGGKTTLGFGVYVPYAGGGVDWKREDLGYPFKSTLGIVSYTPTLAYQFSESFSIGLALNFYNGYLDLNTEMPPFGQMTADEKGSAVSAGIGFLFKPAGRMSFGLHIRGPANLKLQGTTSVYFGTFKINMDSETTFRLPWDFEAGMAYRFSERLLFSTSAQYTIWSRLDKVGKVIKAVPLTGDIQVDEILDFQNILILRAGLEYALPQGLFLRGGVGLDKNATPNSRLNFKNIDVDKLTLLGGVGYRVGRMQIDAAYVYGIGTEREKEIPGSGTAFKEKYNLNIFILGLGITYSF